MSPRKSNNNSKKSSPKKAEEAVNYNYTSNNDESPSKQVKKSTGLKLRLKVSSTESTSLPSASTAASTSASVDDLSILREVKLVPKIKLNFSRSNESVVGKKSGRRGRPKKDKSAVIAAAIAASQPNELESEERKGRRRAAEEKIKKSASMDSVTSAASSTFEGDNEGDGGSGKRRRGRKTTGETEEVDGEEGGKRRKRRGSNETKNNSAVPRQQYKSNDFIDITDGSSIRTNTVNTTSTIVHPTPSASNPHETEFIQRSKTFLNIAMQHDTFLYTSNLANPLDVTAFKSIEEAVEKLLAYHVGIGAGQYSQEELDGKFMDIVDVDEEGGKHIKKYEELQEKYKSVVHSQSTKKVPTELLLLEQRLCLEEEKFLLVKLKNEYAAKFMRGSARMGMGSSGTSRPSTPSSNNSSSSRPDSVINQ